MTHNIEA